MTYKVDMLFTMLHVVCVHSAGVSSHATIVEDQGESPRDDVREPGVCHQWRDRLWENNAGEGTTLHD